MKELKWGDKVEVNDEGGGFLGTRIFLHENEDGSCVCITTGYEGNFYNNNNNGYGSFVPYTWRKNYWRPIPEKKIIPFDFSDAEMLIGRPVKTKTFGDMFIISRISKESIYMSNCNMGYRYLFEEYTFLDGSPCGKEE